MISTYTYLLNDTAGIIHVFPSYGSLKIFVLVIQYNYYFKKNDVATYKKQCNHAKYGHALQRTMNNKTNTSIFENGGQSPKFSVLNPVVVNSDVAVKIE